MGLYLRVKFEASSITLITSFRRKVIPPPLPRPPPQNESLKSAPRLVMVVNKNFDWLMIL